MFRPVQELHANASLASLLLSRHKDAVAETFGEDNMEARLWVAKLQVSVDNSHLQQRLAAAAQEPAEVAALLTAPEPPDYLLPAVNSNQTAVANEIIQRILLAKGEHLVVFLRVLMLMMSGIALSSLSVCPKTHRTAVYTNAGFLQNEPDSYKQGVERLREEYGGGLDFVVLTPVYLTLRQQTLQRLQEFAGLKNSHGSDPVVLPYAFSAPTTVRPEGVCVSKRHGQSLQLPTLCASKALQCHVGTFTM